MQLKKQESEVVLSPVVPLLVSVARLSLGGEELLAVSAIDSGWVGDLGGIVTIAC